MRLFVAIEPPLELRQSLARIAGGVPGARWSPLEAMHLTLRFIGEVDGHRARDCAEALETVRAAPFALNVEGVGQFGDRRRIRHLWAGIAASPPLRELRNRIEAVLVRAGLPPEQRKYSPHITLARLRRGDRGRALAFLDSHGGLFGRAFDVSEFGLYSSHPGQGWSHYRLEAAYPLQA